jgi:osmotically-inducible protein OsmY
VKPKPADVEKRIEEAITREADLDARRIWVTTHNGTAELHGTVHSFWEKRLAEQAAASAPGVAKVENLLAVTP